MRRNRRRRKDTTVATQATLRHADIIQKMNLEQKCALLGGATAFGSRAYPKLGIPEMQFSDGPHGMRHQDPETANHLGIGGSMPATCFPTAVTVANSWEPELSEQLGAALGEEAASQGVSVVLGPGLNIKRSPLCGRNFEYLSEDPYLAGKMAAGYVRGIQSAGVSACPKHFAVNSQETRRQASDSILDDRTLHEIYLTAFEIVVKEAHPLSIMSSYNLINGTYANENEYLLQTVLRDDWGFDGSVITDWGGSNDHNAGVKAGSTFEMPAPGLDPVRRLISAVESGEVPESSVDARVDEAIELILSTRPAVEAAQGKEFDIEAHHQLARRIAAEGIVLLKNDAPTAGEKPLLPLAPRTRVALVGDFAKTPRYQGAGSSLVNCTKLDTLLDAVQASDLEFVGYEQGFSRTGDAKQTDDDRMRAAAVSLAKTADVVLVCLGLDELAESEGLDRSGMRLNQNQVRTLESVAKINPNVVVLLSAGSQVETGWAPSAAGILYLALGGQAGASAAIDVLTGATNPSGKLAESWVTELADAATANNFPSDEPAAEYREGIYVGYRYYQKAGVRVAYPLGYGMSYTTFEYSGIAATVNGVSFEVTNTGKVAGAEIAQVYVSKPESSIFRAKRELKGFAKVRLEPGESRRVTVALDDKAFRYWNVATDSWEVEDGTYVIEVGASSEDMRLSQQVRVEGTMAPVPYQGVRLDSYESGHVANVSTTEFEALLGHKLVEQKVQIDRNICFRDFGRGRSPIFWLVAAIIKALRKRAAANGKTDLNLEFIYNMPVRALAKNAGEFVSMGLVDALVRELKGYGLIGVIPALLCVFCLHWGVGRFILVWLLWVLIPLVFEFVVNLVLNSQGEKRLKDLNN